MQPSLPGWQALFQLYFSKLCHGGPLLGGGGSPVWNCFQKERSQLLDPQGLGHLRLEKTLKNTPPKSAGGGGGLDRGSIVFGTSPHSH